jgi:hypothetical protein
MPKNTEGGWKSQEGMGNRELRTDNELERMSLGMLLFLPFLWIFSNGSAILRHLMSPEIPTHHNNRCTLWNGPSLGSISCMQLAGWC